jgi:hypothetical protein
MSAVMACSACLIRSRSNDGDDDDDDDDDDDNNNNNNNNTFKFIRTVLLVKEQRNESVGYVCNVYIGTGT